MTDVHMVRMYLIVPFVCKQCSCIKFAWNYHYGSGNTDFFTITVVGLTLRVLYNFYNEVFSRLCIFNVHCIVYWMLNFAHGVFSLENETCNRSVLILPWKCNSLYLKITYCHKWMYHTLADYNDKSHVIDFKLRWEKIELKISTTF